jgi:glutamate carboxypeptidase
LDILAQDLQAREADILRDLTELVNIESPTHDKAGVDHAQDYLAGRLRWAGAEVERHAQTGVGDFLRAVWRGEGVAGRSPILLVGHVDTVWPLGELARRPIRQEDGYFYGPGAFDMKAGLLLAIHAMRALRDRTLPLRRDVVFIINTDEEIGSLSSRAMIQAEAKRSHAALILEPAFNGSGLTVARKGVGRFVVRVAGRAAHSGRNPQDGINAVEEMAHQVLTLQALTDSEQGITVNVGVVQGGTRPNVVPAEASAEVDLRVRDMAQAERLTAQILGLRPHLPGAQVTVTGGLNRPPWDESTVCEALYHRGRAIGLALGMQLEKRASGGGSDGNYTAALGVPTLDGLGPEGAGAHAVDERVRIASVAPRAALLAGLLLDLANNGGE